MISSNGRDTTCCVVLLVEQFEGYYLPFRDETILARYLNEKGFEPLSVE